MKTNSKGSDKEEEKQIEEYNIIMDKYQSILKNNENHELIDNKRRERSNDVNGIVLDFSIDNIVLILSFIFGIIGLFFVFFIL